MRRFDPGSGLLVLGVALFATLLLKHISYPLLWQDEAETAMFAQRVVEHGYPLVHGEQNVLYEFGSNIAVGVKESLDAYIGTTWGHFYFAVPGLLWAEGAPDLYAKTARFRLPFALAGGLGVAVWVWALIPVFGSDSRRARLFAGVFFLLAAVSISLILHLREARYYPLMVLLSGAIARVQLRHRIRGGGSRVGYTLTLAFLLVLVFHTFFAAWFTFTALLALDAAVATFRDASAGSSRGRRLAEELAPLLLSALLVAPALIFFETFSIAASFGADLGFSWSGWASNLAFFAGHFWRYEFLAPALACRLAVTALGAGAPRGSSAAPPTAARCAAARLAWFVAGYALLTCANPLVYERYFVLLSPALIGILLLDASTLFDALPRRFPAHSKQALAAGAAALFALVVATSGPRVEAVRGRLQEISVPVRGPLDFAIARLAQEPFPERLVIATNYANHPYMYYLGSHVIVGTNLNNIVRERALTPDVVIPRRRWPRGLAELRAFLRRGEYVREELPVRDVHFNNVPALSRSRSTPAVHRFRTPLPVAGSDSGNLEIFWRADRVQTGNPSSDGTEPLE